MAPAWFSRRSSCSLSGRTMSSEHRDDMQYKDALHKLYELFAPDFPSLPIVSLVESLYLGGRLGRRAVYIVSLPFLEKVSRTEGRWSIPHESRPAPRKDGRFAKFSFPCRGALSPMKLRRPSLPTSTRHGLASCLPGDATFRSRRFSNDGKRPPPPPRDKTWRWITATSLFPARNLLYAFQFYYAASRNFGGEGGDRNFGAEFISFPITSLANNLIEEGAATHIPSPSLWRAA